MPNLTDRQRIELSVPAYLLYALTGLPGVFVPVDDSQATKAQADIAELRGDLQIACLEPFADLKARKRQALLRRLERVTRQLIADWKDQPAMRLTMMLWCFLKDLTDRQILILWEGSAMDRAMKKLMPMCEHGFEDRASAAAAEDQARALLIRLRAEGFYG